MEGGKERGGRPASRLFQIVSIRIKLAAVEIMFTTTIGRNFRGIITV